MLQSPLSHKLDDVSGFSSEIFDYEILISILEQELQALSRFPLCLKERYDLFLNAGSFAELAFNKTLQFAIFEIDQMLNTMLNVILHHERFQSLEASWRGLAYLTREITASQRLKIKLLDVSWQTLAKDLHSAIEFDQSAFFKKIYNAEFDQPGGEPFGLLIGDYFINHHKKDDEIYHPIDTLKEIAKVAAAAFSPFIAAASAKLLELDHYGELQPWMDIGQLFKKETYHTWQKLREEEEIRFVGLVAPRVLRRIPYALTDSVSRGFCFKETIQSHFHYLWGSAAYCFAEVVIQSYRLHSWFVDIRGILRDFLGKGLVTRLLKPSYGVDRLGEIHKPVVEWGISSRQEYDLNQLGIITLAACSHTSYAAFFNSISLQKPKSYEKNPAIINAKLATQLSYLLCCSRFAHYIKVIIRDKLGIFTTSQEIEHYLQQWIMQYTAIIDNMTPDAKTKYPLREAKVTVKQQAGSPGSFVCVIHLRPHFQFDEIEANFSLTTEVK